MGGTDAKKAETARIDQQQTEERRQQERAELEQMSLRVSFSIVYILYRRLSSSPI